jgi:hypothetical protein
MAHTYNPSYLGGRDQEDHGSKPASGNSSQDPIKKAHHEKAGGVAQGVGPEFKPPYCKKINKRPRPPGAARPWGFHIAQ